MSDTRLTIAVALILSLCTCATPLFNVSPAALGKTEWSAWDVMTVAHFSYRYRCGKVGEGSAAQGWRALQGSCLPYAIHQLSTNLVRLWSIYFLLACGLLLLLLPRYVKPVSLCAGLALVQTAVVYMRMQAGWHDGVSIRPEAFVLPGLLIFVFFILSLEWRQPAES